MMLLSSAIVGGFGLIGIPASGKGFHLCEAYDPAVSFLAAMILVPLLVGKTSGSHCLRKCSTFPDFAWRTLAIRWACFLSDGA
ncbi:MAG: hypothetical protein IPG56_20685 [Caulobacteraceae bacterium]|nr:hypothetical protein [Caulobacteraceae bacterium]